MGAPGAIAPGSDSGRSPKSKPSIKSRSKALYSLVKKKGSYCGPIKAWAYDMKEHTDQCIERYVDMAKVPVSSLQKRTTPCIDDHQLQAADSTTKGSLEPIASRVVLKILYTARLGRPDTLWSVNTLARKVTKWNKACDKRLHRLIEKDVVEEDQDPGSLCQPCDPSGAAVPARSLPTFPLSP